MLSPQTGLQQYCFLVFLVICLIVGIYIFFVVPETKNKTFLQIHNEFQKKDNMDYVEMNQGQLSWQALEPVNNSYYKLCKCNACDEE